MNHEPEDDLERSSSSSTRTPDQVVRQANDGKADLVEEQQQHMKYLKDGGTSGITDEFGKPLFFESSEISKAADQPQQEKNIFQQIGEVVTTAVATFGSAVSWVIGGIANLFKGAEAPAPPIIEAPGASAGQPVDLPEPVPSASAPSDHVQPELDKPVFNPLDVLNPPQEKLGPPVPMDRLEDTAKPSYAGEEIRVEIKAAIKKTVGGETLDSFARSQLPPGSSHKVDDYIKQIATINGLDPAAKFAEMPPGKIIKLPGGTKDGAMIVLDENSRVTTLWKNGDEMAKDPGGREYSRKADGSGGFVETHSGPRQEDNFELTFKDGKLLLADKAGEKAREVLPANEEVKNERHKLFDLSREKITDPEKRAKYAADMLRFEERASKNAPPLAPREIVAFYKQQERLLIATGDTPLSLQDRLKIAEQSMSQAATPTSIDQGSHATCNMTTVEAVMYTKTPSEAMKLVADVALTGQYSTKDGTTVKIDPSGTDVESKNNPPLEGHRSHASKLFQVTAVNLYYQKNSYEYTNEKGEKVTAAPGKIEFTELAPKPGAIPPVLSGDRLIDHSTDPPTMIMENWKEGIPLEAPGLADRALVDVPNMITGTKDSVLLINQRRMGQDREGAVVFTSEEDFVANLQKAKDNQKFPVILAVYAGQEPFYHDSGMGQAGGSGGWHVVTLTDFDPATGKVQLDNQWGSKADHLGKKALTAHDLFRATNTPNGFLSFETGPDGQSVNSTALSLQKDIDSNRAKGIVDTAKELELLRIKHEFGNNILGKDKMKDEDYHAALKKTIDDGAANWEKQKAAGTLDKDEYDAVRNKMFDMTSALPADKRVAFLEQMHDKKLIDDTVHRNQLVRTVGKYFAEKNAEKKKSLFDPEKEAAPEPEVFMSKIKDIVAKMPEGLQKNFYKDAITAASPIARLEILQYQLSKEMISPAEYDQGTIDASIKLASVAVGKTETEKFAALLKKNLDGIGETRRLTILTKIAQKTGSSPLPTATA